MLAFRLTLKIKPGCMGKAWEMIQKIKENTPDWKGRIYTPASYAPWETIILEETFESVAEREAFWDKYHGKPEFTAWWDEWFNEIAEGGNSIDVWNLTEV
jgi:hypothetical protein